MKKSKSEWTIGETAALVLSVVIMPIIAILFSDSGSDEFIGYIGLWITIVFGFATVHIKLRKYYHLIFKNGD